MKTVENGCSAGEAELAKAKATEMAAEYGFTFSDAEVKAEKYETREWERPYTVKLCPSDFCRAGISKFCQVEMFTGPSVANKKRRMMKAYGAESDTEMAEWLYDMITESIEAACPEYGKTIPRPVHGGVLRQLYWDFQMGMATRVNERLLDMAAMMEPVVKTSDGTALIPLKGQILADNWAKEKALHTWRPGPQGGTYFKSDRFAAGRAAGDNVNLNRPIRATARARLSVVDGGKSAS